MSENILFYMFWSWSVVAMVPWIKSQVCSMINVLKSDVVKEDLENVGFLIFMESEEKHCGTNISA